jgi:hypothetical protein
MLSLNMELLKQYNKIIEKLEKQNNKLNNHENQIKDIAILVNTIIKKMITETKEIKIKGFNIKHTKK